MPDSSMDRAKAILEPLAKEYFSNKAEKNEEVDLSFFIAAQGDELTESLKRFAKLTQKGPLLAIVDVSTREVRSKPDFFFLQTLVFMSLLFCRFTLQTEVKSPWKMPKHSLMGTQQTV